MKLLLLLLWLASSIDGHCAEGVEDILRKTTASREQELAPLRETLAAAQKIEDLDAASKYASRLEGELAKLPPALQATQPAAEASHFLGSLHTRLAERAARANQWNQARQEALLALKFDSGQAEAEKVRQQAEEVLRRGAGAKGELNSALSDSFFAKLEAVRAGLERGEALRETGQLEKADRAFQEVLKMDPFNEAAVAGLAKIHEEILLVSEKRRDTAFQQKKQEVRSLFSNLREVEPSTSDSRSSSGGGMAKGPAEMINSRLEAIRIPEVNFPGLDLESLRRALNALAAQYDPNPPQGKPISFFISPELAEKETAPISLRLRNATLGDIVRYASQVANIKARFDGRGVILGPLVEEGEIILRSFPRVSPSFFAAETKTSAEEGPAKIRGGTGLTSRLGGTPDGGQVGAQEYLQKLGVDFTNPKSFAVYNTSTKTLKVANTPEMCDLVGNLIAAAQEDTLLIRIDCRLVEINQTDLDSLTVNTTVGSQQSELFNVFPQGLIPSSTGSTPTPSAQQGVTMQLNQIQGVGLLPNNTLQSFLAPGVLAGPNQASSYDLNTMQLGGSIMGGTQFRTFITAISQKSSANVLASPTLVLKRGQKGTIEVSQEFRFVQEYNDPQSSIRTFIPFGGAAGIGGFVTPIPGPETVISAFPSQISDPEPIGVKMGVKPDVTGENTRVLLELEPTFVDFEGFINYGAVVNSAYAATYFGDATTILTNNIQQPVFVRRDLVIPPVEVKDGHTLTLGGLLREDIQTIDEKVPIFGDIPLLGRAFQGKTEQAIKKNTLIFVTPRILRTDGAPLNPTAGAEDAASTMDDLVYASPPPPAAN